MPRMTKGGTNANGATHSRAGAIEVVTFRVDRVLARDIRRAARADGRRVSPFLRRLVAGALAESQTQSGALNAATGL
jgi:hypothetical protein